MSTSRRITGDDISGFTVAYNIADRGAGAVGAVDDRQKFLDAFTAVQAVGAQIMVPALTYPLSANTAPSAGDVAYWQDPKAAFSGVGKFRFGNLMPYIPQPVYSLDLYSKTYGTEWNGYKNIMQRASYAKSNVVRGGASAGPAVVALFGSGEAALSGAYSWAMNLAGYASADGAVSISNETDSAALTSASIAYNTVLVAVGNYPTVNAIQIQSNQAAAGFTDGIVFNNRQATSVPPAGGDPVVTDIPAIIGSQIKSDTGTAQQGLNIVQTTYSVAEIQTGNFLVGPSTSPAGAQVKSFLRVDGSLTNNPTFSARATDASATNVNIDANGGGAVQLLTGGVIQCRISHTAGATDRVQLTGGAGDVTVTTSGSSTNSSVSISGKGTGGVKLRDGAGTLRLQVTTTGLGFFNHAAAAQQTAPSALLTDGTETNANICTAVNALRTALLNLGLIA